MREQLFPFESHYAIHVQYPYIGGCFIFSIPLFASPFKFSFVLWLYRLFFPLSRPFPGNMLVIGVWLGLALAASHVYALPKPESDDGILSATASPSAVIIPISIDPLLVATGPTCIQTRSSGHNLASDIWSLFKEDDTIRKACNVGTQSVTTIDNGLVSVIYYGLDDTYFFNMSHSSLAGKAEVVSPSACSETFNSIVNTCVTSQNFWGGWVMNDATNHSSEWLALRHGW